MVIFSLIMGIRGTKKTPLMSCYVVYGNKESLVSLTVFFSPNFCLVFDYCQLFIHNNIHLLNLDSQRNLALAFGFLDGGNFCDT